MTQATRDTEYTLKKGDQTVVVSPYGASLRHYSVGAWNVLWGYSGGANKQGGQGDVLIPFPGRIKQGQYSFDDRDFQLVKNDKDGPNAIHGFVRAEIFKTERVTDTSATFSFEIDNATYSEKGYPFTIHIEVSYELRDEGLKVSYQVTNRGSMPAPVGVGFHPYFRADRGSLPSWSAKIPAKDYIELESFVPTGRVLPVDGTPLDFRSGRKIGETRYNDCVAHLERGPDGFAHVTLQAEGSDRRVSIRLDASFDYVVVYTGDSIAAPHQRQGFAIEPMTCAPDAFNHEGWGTRALKAGQMMSGSYVIAVDAAQH